MIDPYVGRVLRRKSTQFVGFDVRHGKHADTYIIENDSSVRILSTPRGNGRSALCRGLRENLLLMRELI